MYNYFHWDIERLCDLLKVIQADWMVDCVLQEDTKNIYISI